MECDARISTTGVLLRLDFFRDNQSLAITSNHGISEYSFSDRNFANLVSTKHVEPCFAWIKSQNQLIYSSDRIVLADLNTGVEVSTTKPYVLITDCNLIDDHHIVFSGTQTVDIGVGGDLVLARITNGTLSDFTTIAKCTSGAAWSCSAARTDTGIRIAVGYSGDCPVEIIDFQKDEQSHFTEVSRHQIPQSSDRVVLNRDGSRLGMTTDNSVLIYSISEQNEISEFTNIPFPTPERKTFSREAPKLPSSYGRTLSISDKGNIVAFVCEAGLVVVDLNKDTTRLASLPTSCVALSPDGLLLAAGHERGVRIYRTSNYLSGSKI